MILQLLSIDMLPYPESVCGTFVNFLRLCAGGRMACAVEAVSGGGGAVPGGRRGVLMVQHLKAKAPLLR